MISELDDKNKTGDLLKELAERHRTLVNPMISEDFRT
jgi:hypothetical protein